MQSFAVRKNSQVGRFAIATRDLHAGEFLFDEFPFAIGPKPSTICCCLECFIPVNATAAGSRCESCSWPLCVDCKKLSETKTHKRECEIFTSTKCKFYNLTDPSGVSMQLDCITPLRVLLEKESNPKRWSTEVEPMEHHRERRFGTETWKVDAQNVVSYLLHGPCKLKQQGIDADLIQQVIGILEVNSFEGKTVKGHSMRCLYPKLAVLSHSCTPNVFHSIHPSKGYKFEGRATVLIKKNSPLNACYTFTLSGTMERQQHLQQGKFFQCKCERCLDPTELGTNFSSLKCQKCHSGNVISSDPLNSQAIWKCNKCSFEDTAENIKHLLKGLQDEIDSTNSIDSYENLLEKYKSILHSNHFMMICIKNALIDSYGHVKGYSLSEVPDALLRRKIELCQEVLEILNVFEVGKSRVRGLMMYELYGPMVIYAKSRYGLGNLSKLEYLRQLEDARNVLKSCLEILMWEDENVYKPIKMAKFSLNNLENLIENVKEN